MSIDTRARRAADGVHASTRGINPMTQIVDLHREVKTRQRTGVAVTAAVVLVLVAGAFALGARFIGSDETAPPAGPSRTDKAQQVVSNFFAAYDAYDADRMLTYLSDEGIATQWDSPQDLRSDTAWLEAAGWTESRDPCRASSARGGVIDLRCDYGVQAMGSEQLGRGPYGGAYWALHVQGDHIVYAHSEFPHSTNGFAAEMWEPFLHFVETEYPDDADVMFSENGSEGEKSPAALRLWKQRVGDYVASETAG
jgi:hypothetical protein